MFLLDKLIRLSGLLPQLLSTLGIAGTYQFLKLRRSTGNKTGKIHLFSPKRLGRQTIAIREGTTDIGSFQDFLTTRFYLPPWQLPENPTIVDLGANIGTAAADYAATFPGARIVSLEMDASNAEIAIRNTSESRDRVKIVNTAIWHESQTVQYDGGNEDGFHIDNNRSSGNSVRAITMGDLIEQEQICRIDFLKIDIEGAEEQLFTLGSLAWLDHVDSISCEIHGQHLFDPIVHALKERGFSPERDSRHWSTIIAKRI